MECVARITNAHKGLALGTLLIIILAVAVMIASILIFTGQSDFLTRVAKYLGSLLVVKLP